MLYKSFLLKKLPIITLIPNSRVSFQHRINKRYFSWPIFSVIFTKILLYVVVLIVSATLNLGFVSIFSVKAEETALIDFLEIECDNHYYTDLLIYSNN